MNWDFFSSSTLVTLISSYFPYYLSTLKQHWKTLCQKYPDTYNFSRFIRKNKRGSLWWLWWLFFQFDDVKHMFELHWIWVSLSLTVWYFTEQLIRKHIGNTENYKVKSTQTHLILIDLLQNTCVSCS